MAKGKKGGGKGKRRLADRCDPYLLYQLSVQDPVSPTLSLMRTVFRKRRKRQGEVLREDFCGTALLSMEWVRLHGNNQAIAIDIDDEPLAWAREHFAPQLSEEQTSRVHLLQQDVMKPLEGDDLPTPDIVCAYNFSYMYHRTREGLRSYFASCREQMAEDGMLFLDLFGGAEAIGALEEETEVEVGPGDPDSPLLGHLIEDPLEFSYIWHQRQFNPVDHEMRNSIHFCFPDGSKRRDAFRYDWRLWSIPEIRELLAEAGFASSEVHWEASDDEGEFVGYKQVELMEDDPCWIVFIAACR